MIVVVVAKVRDLLEAGSGRGANRVPTDEASAVDIGATRTVEDAVFGEERRDLIRLVRVPTPEKLPKRSTEISSLPMVDSTFPHA